MSLQSSSHPPRPSASGSSPHVSRTNRSLSASSRSEADSEDHGFSQGFDGGGAATALLLRGRLFFLFFSPTLRPASASASSSAAAPSEEAVAAAAIVVAAAIVAVAVGVAAAAAAAAASAQARSASSARTAGRIATAWSPAKACSSSRRQRGSSRHRSGTDSTRSRVESCNGFGGPPSALIRATRSASSGPSSCRKSANLDCGAHATGLAPPSIAARAAEESR
mmetsp:Transcript_39090/g.123161  ORF Transcript_39090/g.123161 Transcript_39090/m.123161 type:complete len:223 (-) Transcript_39090:287-955(-)